MAKKLSVEDVVKAGGKLPGRVTGVVIKAESDSLALEVLGILAKATNNPTRRKALEKARRMLGAMGKKLSGAQG